MYLYGDAQNKMYEGLMYYHPLYLYASSNFSHAVNGLLSWTSPPTAQLTFNLHTVLHGSLYALLLPMAILLGFYGSELTKLAPEQGGYISTLLLSWNSATVEYINFCGNLLCFLSVVDGKIIISSPYWG